MILNGLPWKQTEIILSFLRLHPSTAFRTLFTDRDGYSISSEGFLPTVVDIMVTAMARALSVAERSSPESKVRGGGREEPPHVRAQGQWSEGATPRPRPRAPAWKINPRPKSGGCAGAGGPRGAIPR